MIYWKDFDVSTLKFGKLKKRNSNVYVANLIIAFDIETTSMFFIDNRWRCFSPKKLAKFSDYYKDVEKTSFCYIWQLGFKTKDESGNWSNQIIYGRHLTEFKEFLKQLISIHQNTEFIIYVHNLSYEFQFLRNIFNDMKVFARKERKPMKVSCLDNKIVFKCSLMLTNLSLDMLAKIYNLDHRKLGGKLIYTKPHFPDTQLEQDELKYCENDIHVVLDYIFIEWETSRKQINKIPLTATSKVRKALRKKMCGNYKYLAKMQNLVPSVNIMKRLMKTYMGATTHANPLWVGYHCTELHCLDISSSYPTVLIAYKYPCSSFLKLKNDDFEKINVENYAFMSKIKFKNLESNCLMNYISFSKCENAIGLLCENGKVISAKSLEMWVTEIDYEIINNCYSFDYEIIEVYVARKDYLDIGFIELVLELYEMKTKLKGKDDDVTKRKYLSSKEKLNSLYGMCVTNLICDQILFEDEWKSEPLTDEIMSELLSKQKKSKNTLLQFSTGVWCTAYARMRLWKEGLIPLKKDIVYTDTDSVKFFNYEKHKNHFKKCNYEIIKKLEKGCRGQLDLLVKLCPKDNYGVIHPLGIWDDEGVCDFKTYGSKKYISEKKGKLEVTVAGLNKKLALNNPQLKTIDDFKTGLKFDSQFSGRMICYYQDEQLPLVIDDHVIDNNRYGIVMQPTSYTLNVTKDYNEFLKLNSVAYNYVIINEYLKEV